MGDGRADKTSNLKALLPGILGGHLYNYLFRNYLKSNFIQSVNNSA